MRPKFSIIIPVYNVAPYLRECLDSVLVQTFTDWEAICVDDGSTDGSGAILDEYAARDKRFCVIHQANAGQSMARNAALEIATGEWLFYLDSDDVLSPWALETYVKMMEKYPRADILRAGMATNTGGAWNWGAASGESRGIDVHGHMSMYGRRLFSAMAYKRVVHGDIRFVGVGWGEDRLYVAKCLARAKYVTDTSVVAYGFRVREGSITHRKMTLEEWADFMAHTLEMAHVCAASGKMVDGRLIRSIVNQLLEDRADMIYTFLPKEFRRTAWEKWFESLSDVMNVKGATPWQKCTARLCAAVPSRMTPIVLYLIPHWLKKMGINRGLLLGLLK